MVGVRKFHRSSASKSDRSQADEAFFRAFTSYCHVAELDGPSTFLEVWPVFCASKARCESPIEEILCGALVIARHLCQRIGRPFDFEQQAKVGKYRVDFLCDAGRIKFAVECDGHDFHEKTRKQAARDRARDRFLAIEGIHTLRFTGSEIYSQTDQCMNEIQAFVQSVESRSVE